MPHGMAWHGMAQLGIESAQSSGIAVMRAGTIHEPTCGLRHLLVLTLTAVLSSPVSIIMF